MPSKLCDAAVGTSASLPLRQMRPLTAFPIRTIIALLVPLFPATVAAQNSDGRVGPTRSVRSGHSAAVPTAHADHRRSAVVLDGTLDEEAWRSAEPITQFTQYDPEEGKPPSQRTEVRFLFDDDAIYVGARLHDDAGRSGIRTRVVRRDATFNSDYLQIVIDGFHDHLSRAFFVVNPSGSKQDQLGIGTSCCDSGWDPIWEVATRIDSAGWTAELRIPLSQLRFSRDSVQTWGLQVRRWIDRRQELDEWSFFGKKDPGGPSRFGHLDGLRIAHASRHLELLPFVASRASAVQADPRDPYHAGVHSTARTGLDAKYLLTPNLTLDATFNPDFGQVEVDPAVVNLSVFEVSFPEKRPFFLSGAGVFSFGGLNCYFCSNVSSLSAFYSRRIGRPPSGADLAQGQFVDVPDASTILGAAKITGRTSNGYTIGVLDAVTNRESAHVVATDGSRSTPIVEPLTNYFVGRIKKDMLQGNLVVGGMLTSTARRMEPVFDARLNDHSELLGGDIRYTWDARRYSFTGNAALSNIHGDRRVITARQLSSARYYQRPDRNVRTNGFLTDAYDTTATAMRGLGAYMRVGKDAGTWLWESALNVRTPGFENNDLALLTRSDYVWMNANVVRNWTKPTRWYRDLSMTAGGQQQRNFDGALTDRQLHYYVGTNTPQFWYISSFYIWRPPVMDERLLRGGPTVQRPGTNYVELDASTDSRRKLRFNFATNTSSNEIGGWSNNLSVNVQYRPSSKVSASIGPSWSDSRSMLQYVTSVSDPTLVSFAGRRYVLSTIKQKQLGIETRFSMTFTPTMSFELYAQPLLASGHYLDFKEFNAPGQGKFSVYGRDRGTIAATRGTDSIATKYTIDADGAGALAPFSFGNPDFTLRSLRGNAVYRWEFRPGSVLYLAWTHSRSGSDHSGDLELGRDRDALFGTSPDNIFLVKASWWYAR